MDTLILGSEFQRAATRKKKLSLWMMAVLMVVGSLVTLSHGFAAEPATFLLSVPGQSDKVSVTGNQPFTIEVEALDSALQTITEYTGTVNFTSTDPQVKLPNNYTFTATDAGKKTFNLSFTLSTAGAQTITVIDTAKASTKSEISITVSGGTTGGTSNANKPIILLPNDGSKINTNTVDIVGTTAPKTEVSFLDGTNLLGTAQSDDKGDFEFTTDTLFDGTHTFSVTVLDAAGKTLSSTPITVTVDTTSAANVTTTLAPESTTPGGSVLVTVKTEPALQAVKVVADQRAISLVEDTTTPGTYTGNFIAPTTAGEYPLTVEVTDKSNNPQTYQDQVTLTVEAGEVLPPPNQPPVASAVAVPATGASPLKVQFTSQASDSDGQVVSYLWDFGDGSTSIEPNPSHEFIYDPADGEPGQKQYPVSLTVTDDKGATTMATITSITAEGSFPVSAITVLSDTGPAAVGLVLLALGLSAYLNRKKLGLVRR